MKTYEALVIFPFQMGLEGHQDQKNVFEEIIKKHEGKVLNRNEIGRRPLGYPIKKSKEGYFVSFVFELSPDQVEAFKRSLQLAEEILKFTIVVKPKVDFSRHAKSAPSHAVQTGEKRQGISHGS